MSLVTIKVFNNSNDYNMAKAYLESADISCFAQNEFINQVYANAVGGVRMQVMEDQVEEAVALLIEGGFAKPEDYEIPESVQKTEKIVNWLRSLFE